MADQEKLEKLVQKKHWDKLRKSLRGGNEEQLALARACASSDADECCNILVTLLHEDSREVQLAAVNSLGAIGNDHATAQLQWLLTRLTPDETELIDAIHAAIKNVRNKQ